MTVRVRWGVALAVLCAVVGAATSSARAGTALVVTGHGWGHGVGMSQWGAYGYALHGWSYRRILAHYYPGTKLSRAGDPNVRILLVQSARTVTVGCAAPLKVSNGRRTTYRLHAGTYGLGARLVLPVRRSGVGRAIGPVAVFECARAPLTLSGRSYHGAFVVRSNGKRLSVVNVLRLDTYVRDVVPCESPSHWPLAELEAQAVAARSYAVSELRPDARYDLLPDTRDQVYGGVAAERPRSDRAVYKTLGQVLTWDGEVARTYYSSSSGGRTESVQDAWPGSAPIPYLRSVADPWDVYSPHHSWGPIELSASTLAARLGLGGAVASVQLERDRSARVETARFELASGAIVSRSAEQVAQALDLRSTWFSIGELQLSTSRTRVLYGSRVDVVARARGAPGAVLQERRGDGWRTLRRVGSRGARLALQARANTAFRLTLPGTSGTSVDVDVAPRLTARPVGPLALTGSVQPRGAAPLEVWRLERGAWRVVAHPRLDPQGAFLTRLRLRPGSYKVTVPADGSLASAQRRFRVTRRLLESLRR